MSTHGSCNGCGKGFGIFKKEVRLKDNINPIFSLFATVIDPKVYSKPESLAMLDWPPKKNQGLQSNIARDQQIEKSLIC